MTKNPNQTKFSSILLIVFTAVVCVMVLYALASSASFLGQLLAFIMGLVAFIFFIAFAIYQLERDNKLE